MTNSNVIPLPRRAKTVAPDQAGEFAFVVLAATDRINDDPLNTMYREELVVVDPDAPLRG